MIESRQRIAAKEKGKHGEMHWDKKCWTGDVSATGQTAATDAYAGGPRPIDEENWTNSECSSQRYGVKRRGSAFSSAFSGCLFTHVAPQWTFHELRCAQDHDGAQRRDVLRGIVCPCLRYCIPYLYPCPCSSRSGLVHHIVKGVLALSCSGFLGPFACFMPSLLRIPCLSKPRLMYTFLSLESAARRWRIGRGWAR